MPRLPSSQPTEVELQILRMLWEHGPSTAREIHNQLSGERETNYSTTVKMLSVMLDKKLVERDETVRPQIYRTAVTQERTQERMLKDLIKKAYSGSVGSLVLQALSSQKSSAGELSEIRHLLNKLEGDEK
jgi:BlaI family penicillinase repressor